MFRSLLAGKSRRKAAILGGALVGVLTPLASQASLTVSFSLSPTVAGIASTPSKVYIDPTQTADIPVYVYATVTGTVAGDYQGLDYAYYNVNNAVTNTGTALVDTADTAVTAFPPGAAVVPGGTTGFQGTVTYNPGTGNVAAVSAQFGTISNTANGISVGDSTGNTTEDLVKPTSSGGSGSSQFGTTGASQTFLVETINVKPSAFNASSATSLNATRFFPNLPSLATFATDYPGYAEANWNEDSTTNTGDGTTTSVRTTSGNTGIGTYTTNGTGVAVIDTIPGDANHDGQVGFGDLTLVLAHYGATDLNWSDGNFDYGLNGPGAGNVNDTIGFGDLTLVLSHYGVNLGSLTPNVVTADAEVFADPQALSTLQADGFTVVPAAVPEPVSLGMVGLFGAATLLRRRRRAL